MKLNRRIQPLLDSLVATGAERGLQIAAYHRGQLVLDACAGETDARSHRPVTADTLFPVFSTGKGITSTLVHIFAQRGQLDYETPIAHYWPEFAANGKSTITIRHALSHGSGLPYIPAEIRTGAQLDNWQTMCAALARQAPAWPAGERIEYHAITFGWILGEVLCRIAGRPFPQILADEICRPLGLTSLFIGLPEAAADRVATLDVPATPPPADPGKPEAIPHWLWPLEAWMNRPDTRRACIPASNGVASARDLARHYAALIPGGVDGVELVPPARITLATQLQRPTGPLPAANRVGLGYMLGGESDDMGRRDTAFGHGGYGGSAAFADPERHLAVGLTRNRFSAPDTGKQLIAAVREALGVPA